MRPAPTSESRDYPQWTRRKLCLVETPLKTACSERGQFQMTFEHELHCNTILGLCVHETENSAFTYEPYCRYRAITDTCLQIIWT
jgi:hypothetical protein